MATVRVAGVAIVLLFCTMATYAHSFRPHRTRARLGFSTLMDTRRSAGAVRVQEHAGVENCTVHYFPQIVDHFGWEKPSGGQRVFKQRYFVCDSFFDRSRDPPVMFFYVGNEADVTLYVNETGLMWESAPQFGALLVFAEHRYYGETQPFGNKTSENMNYLSSEQALADYATLIRHLRAEYDMNEGAVIGFGGSYGGMLTAWLRLKYPSAIDGGIAASAPIMSFLGEDPPYLMGEFGRIVSRDASSLTTGSHACRTNIRSSWDVVFSLASTDAGRAALQEAFSLCEQPDPDEQGYDVAFWAQSAFDYMAMGNYPYPSNYITNGDGTLPAFPMSVACDAINGTYGSSEEEQLRLMRALRDAVAVFYNATGTLECFDLSGSVNNDTSNDANYWDYQWCTEMTQPSERNGVTDMFFPQPWSLLQASIGCEEAWGVRPRALWATINYGGWRIEAGSNLVFSNGLLDPWSGGGVMHDINPSMVAIVIEESAHHLDLMWSNVLDPESVRNARQQERAHISDWIQQVQVRNSQRRRRAEL